MFTMPLTEQTGVACHACTVTASCLVRLWVTHCGFFLKGWQYIITGTHAGSCIWKLNQGTFSLCIFCKYASLTLSNSESCFLAFVLTNRTLMKTCASTLLMLYWKCFSHSMASVWCSDSSVYSNIVVSVRKTYGNVCYSIAQALPICNCEVDNISMFQYNTTAS